uniref:ribosomal protein S10 n=1 Tax=Haslea karadagensis TaxID=1146996 RepID=UPI002204B6DA|nr:ribosomal protein S10 [Haslea karadagensis]UXN44270.1 ribosomal protein S10 [Haslea karadagensis]
MNYIVIISSKNKDSLKNFFNFYNKKLNPVNNHSLVLSQNQKKTSRNIVSVLKSPHVNKTAQVHYSASKFTKQILIFSYKSFLFFLFFKKVQAQLFPDVAIEIKSFLKIRHNIKLNSKFLDPDHFLIDLTSINSISQENSSQFNSSSVLPIKKLKLLKQKKSRYKILQDKLLCSKILNYLKVWDCYGEAVFLSFN